MTGVPKSYIALGPWKPNHKYGMISANFKVED